MNKPNSSFNYDKCPVPVVVFKKNGTDFVLDYWNPAAVKMTYGHIVKSNPHAKKIFEQSKDIVEDLRRCYRRRKTFQTERVHYFQQSGRVGHYLATYNPLPGDRVEVFLVDITKQKNYENRILLGKETMSRLVKSSDFTMILCERDLRICFYTGPERYGLTSRKTSGVKLDELMTIKNIADIRSDVRRVFETGESVYHREKKYLINGKTVWMNDNFYPVPDENGKVKFVGYIGRDVTHIKDMEAQLSDSEIRYRNIFDNIQDGICYCEFDRKNKSGPSGFRIMDVNPAFALIMNRKMADCAGVRGEGIFRGIYRDILNNREVLFRKKSLVFEWEKEDIGKFLKTSAFYVREEQFVMVTEDISGRKETEEKILQSEKKYREITDLVKVIILDIDPDYRVEFMNEYAVSRLLSGNRRKNEALHLSEIVDPKDKDRLMSACDDIMSGRETELKAFHLRPIDGGRIFALSNAVRLASSGKTTGVRLAVFELNEIASSIVFPDAELNRKFNLSKRESDVLFSQISGLTDQDIADKLFISKPTVRFHITNLYNKLGVNNKRELFEFMKNNFVKKMGYENLLIYILNSFVRD